MLRLPRVDGDGDDNLVRVPTAVVIYIFHMHSDVAGEGSSGVEAEAYDRNNGETPTEQFSKADRPRRGLCLCTFGVVMYLELVSGRGGSPVAKYFTRDLEKALAAADKLKAAGLRPNVVRSGPNYVVYIDTAELLRLAEKNDEIRRAVALYLAEKAKNGTPRQREIAENPTNALFNPGLPLL